MITSKMKRSSLGTAMAAVLVSSLGVAAPAPALAQVSKATKPANDIDLSVGTGQQVRLSDAMSDLFVANDAIADVQVRSPSQIYIFGKSAGETTVYATNKAGKVIYSANIRVGTNIGSLDEMLKLAMPDAQVRATPMNGMVLLTGTVAAPADVEEASRLVQAFVGDKSQVISRIKTATPLQVMLQVKIAEVSRSVAKDIGVNLLTRDQTGGFMFGVSRGRPLGTIGDITGTIPDPATGLLPVLGTSYTINAPAAGTAINAFGNLLGLDILSALDLAENDGKVVTLAEPTLVALSGETASFLAGGEFPIASSSGLNGTTIEFKEYGVSLAFTPIVLEGGRISMRVRPEVSELTQEGAIRINGFSIPALTTRRAETTVELGSGQSFMIGGLMRNTANNAVEKAPWLGDIPILGALFRSTSFRKNETELVIVVTPYLVKPVSAGQIALPTDGYRTSNEAQRVLLDKSDDSRTGEQRVIPRSVSSQTITPGVAPIGAVIPSSIQAAPAQTQQSANRPQGKASAKPGFSF